MLAPARQDITIYAGVSQTEAFRLLVDSKPRVIWTQNTPYVVGDFVTKKTSDDGSVFLAVVAGSSHATTEPTWPTVMGGRVVDNGVTWMKVDTYRLLDTTGYTATWKVRDVPGGTVLASGSTADGRAEVGPSPIKWAANTAKVAGNQVVPTVFNGWKFQAETAGTTHATTEPTWPTTLGATVSDGTVVWRNVGTDDDVSNCRIVLTGGYTGGLDFGVGVFDLDATDAFGKVQPILAGYATLSKKVAET